MRGSESVQGEQVFAHIGQLLSRGERVTAGRLKADLGIGHARAVALLEIWRDRNPGVLANHQPSCETSKAVFAVLRARLAVVKESELVDIANTIATILAPKEKAS